MNNANSLLSGKAAYQEDWPEQPDPYWSAYGRLAFRYATCYVVLSFLTVYGILTVIPGIGYRLESWTDAVWQWPVVWLGRHLFHLTGIAAQPHASDSRDTALDWIAAGLVIPTSLIFAGVWTLLDRSRLEYGRAV